MRSHSLRFLCWVFILCAKDVFARPNDTEAEKNVSLLFDLNELPHESDELSIAPLCALPSTESFHSSNADCLPAAKQEEPFSAVSPSDLFAIGHSSLSGKRELDGLDLEVTDQKSFLEWDKKHNAFPNQQLEGMSKKRKTSTWKLNDTQIPSGISINCKLPVQSLNDSPRLKKSSSFSGVVNQGTCVLTEDLERKIENKNQGTFKESKTENSFHEMLKSMKNDALHYGKNRMKLKAKLKCPASISKKDLLRKLHLALHKKFVYATDSMSLNDRKCETHNIILKIADEKNILVDFMTPFTETLKELGFETNPYEYKPLVVISYIKNLTRSVIVTTLLYASLFQEEERQTTEELVYSVLDFIQVFFKNIQNRDEPMNESQNFVWLHNLLKSKKSSVLTDHRLSRPTRVMSMAWSIVNLLIREKGRSLIPNLPEEMATLSRSIQEIIYKMLYSSNHQDISQSVRRKLEIRNSKQSE